MSTVEQPLLGSLLEQLRSSASPSGRKLSRTDFGKLLDMTPTQVRNIEQGRSLKTGEYEKIAARFPQIETGELLVQAVHPTGTAAGQSTLNAMATTTTWTGQRCILCHASYRDDGSVQHKSNCPSALPRSESPYCTCTSRVGWTDVDGEWVCGNCGKKSKLVYEQQFTVYGDLIALDEELEDPEEQEAPRAQVLIPVSEVVTRPTLYFSNSEIQTFKQCRRKWYLAWYRQLRLKAQDPVGALAIGNRVHRALQAWYVPEGETPTDPRAALEVAISADWEACKQAYAGRGLEPSPELVKQFNEDTALERAMVEGYIQWLAETGVDSGLRVIASETYMEAPISIPRYEHVSVKLIGKLDVRLVRERDNVRLFMDNKTTASLTEPLKTIRMDEQLLHYMLLEWLHAQAEQERKNSLSLDRTSDVSGAQFTASVALPLLWEVDNHGDRNSGVDSAPPRRESHEQQPSQSSAYALGMPQPTPQQGQHPHIHRAASSESQQSYEATRSRKSQVDTRAQSQVSRDNASEVGRSGVSSEKSTTEEGSFSFTMNALYNMLRKVKRTARANPPFFDRVEVRHNIHELESFKRRVTGVIQSMLDTRAQLNSGVDHREVAYPTPSRDCGWKCDFLPVCPMHDDGSRVEHAIEQYYEVGDPYSYYREKKED